MAGILRAAGPNSANPSAASARLLNGLDDIGLGADRKPPSLTAIAAEPAPGHGPVVADIPEPPQRSGDHDRNLRTAWGASTTAENLRHRPHHPSSRKRAKLTDRKSAV